MQHLINILMFRKGEATVAGMIVIVVAEVLAALGNAELAGTVRHLGEVVGTYGVVRKGTVAVAEKKYGFKG
jgi:hypothetical protein